MYLLVFILPIETRWIIKAGRLNNGPWEYGTYSLYGTDILLLVVLTLFIIFIIFKVQSTSLKQIRNLKFEIRNYFISGLLLMSAVSIFFALDKFLALYKFGWLILGLGLFWLVVKADYSRLKLISAVFASAFLQAGLGIWQFLNQATFTSKWLGLASHNGADLGASVVEAAGAVGSGERWLRAYGGLDHPNILGGLMVIGIILLIGEIIAGERLKNFPPLAKAAEDKQFSPLGQSGGGQAIFNDKIFKFINWFLAPVFTVALFFSFSRSAWLALAAALAVMIILAVAGGNLKSQKCLAEIILTMGILLLALFGQHQNLIASRLGGEGRLEIKSNFERLKSSQEAWRLIKNNWLFGAGLGNYTLALSHELPGQGSYFYQPAHNVFFLVFSEVGIFGLLFFLGLLFAMARSISIARHDSKTAILIALVVFMLFDHWFWSLHFGVLFFWLVLGLVSRNLLPDRQAHNS